MCANNLSKNIFLQCKRASKLLDLPLSKAKDLISIVVYQCHNFEDLSQKLSKNGLKPSVFPFCKIHPKSDEKLFLYLESKMDCLSERFSEFLITSVNPQPLYHLIWKIFGIEPSSVLAQNQVSISLKRWLDDTYLAGEQHTVVFTYCKINDVPFKIVATKVVTPNMFSCNTLSEIRQLSEEFSAFKFYPILWKNWHDWQTATDVYFNSVNMNPTAFERIFSKLITEKNGLEESYEAMLFDCLKVVSEENVGTSLRCVSFDEDSYYVVGYPVADIPNSEECEELYLSSSHIKNGKCLIALDDNLVCLDLFDTKDKPVSSDYGHLLPDAMSEFEDQAIKYIVIDGISYEAYLRPATEAEFDNSIWQPIFVDNQQLRLPV